MAVKQTAGRDALGEFAPKFAELNDEVLFGQVWSREDKLSLRDRSLVTVVALMAQGLTDSAFRYHLTAAKNNGITRTEIAEILTHAWPGNVRELRQKIMGAVLQAQTGLVTKEHLELAVTRATSPVSFALRSDAEDKERVLRALKQANGNRKVAAELLGIGRTTLYNKLEEYGLKYKFQQS